MPRMANRRKARARSLRKASLDISRRAIPMIAKASGKKTPGSKIVKRRHEETVSEISQSAENDQAAWAGRRSHICWDLVHYGSAASQCVDVLHTLGQRHFKPAFAAILSAEHLAIARRDV